MLNSFIFDFTIFSDLKLFCLEERFKQMLQNTLDLIALLLCEKKNMQILKRSHLSFLWDLNLKEKCLDGNTKEKVKGEMEMIKKTKGKGREREAPW